MSGTLAGPHILVAGDEMVEDMRPGLERARAEALR
jgi:hypothetical protein